MLHHEAHNMLMITGDWPSTQPNRAAHNPAAHHQAAHNPAARWCAAGLCVTLMGYSLVISTQSNQTSHNPAAHHQTNRYTRCPDLSLFDFLHRWNNCRKKTVHKDKNLAMLHCSYQSCHALASNVCQKGKLHWGINDMLMHRFPCWQEL